MDDLAVGRQRALLCHMAASIAALLSRLGAELGVPSIARSSRDTKLLCLQRFVRLFAYGVSTLVLVLYLNSLGVSDARAGLFMTLTLLGDVGISLCLTVFADGVGRRKILIAGAGMLTMSGVVFALSGSYYILVAASIVGVISPSGNEIGPFKAIEESTLSQLNKKEVRSEILAWYGMVGTAGIAMGTISCGLAVDWLQTRHGWTPERSYRAMFGVYACLGLVKLVLSLMLSKDCEAQPAEPGHQDVNGERQSLLPAGGETPEPDTPRKPPPRKAVSTISAASVSILLTLCLLFAVDSLASGLVPGTWMVYFFTKKFSLPESQLGTLFFATNIVAAVSNLFAASIAKRIGLVNTMVFTHMPSAICLALIPIPSSPLLAMALLVLRSSTASMDQAPRQAFIAAAVLPSERTAVMGIVNVVKTLSQSAGPIATGWLAGLGKFWIAFVVAGSLKVSYDVCMLILFRGFRGREEEESGRLGSVSEEETEANRG